MSRPEALLVVDIKECARCGQNHRHIAFKRLSRPVHDGRYTHWCMCPVRHEPILMEIRQAMRLSRALNKGDDHE